MKSVLAQWSANLACVAVALMVVVSCAATPEPGDLVIFCARLQSSSGLAETPDPTDLDHLVEVAPPEMHATMDRLKQSARSFSELLAESPPDLEALFNARFDPGAVAARRELASFAESECGITIDRPPSTRWTLFVQQRFSDAPWRELAVPSFDASDGKISSATLHFADPPEPDSLLYDACAAMSAFLEDDAAGTVTVRIYVGSTPRIDYVYPSDDQPCAIP